MSNGYVAYLSKQDIEDRKRHRKERLTRAKALVAEHFPVDENGYLDGWAVMATMELWHERGEGNVKLRDVKARRSQYLARLEMRKAAA